ncbi:hypothetical protein [uncultured Intestinibacter sp.]|nr:hypothetical protein [uncultured Intestinibacter sp.]
MKKNSKNNLEKIRKKLLNLFLIEILFMEQQYCYLDLYFWREIKTI